MNAETGAVEATAETGAAGNMVVETTVDSETTGAEETTGEETDNNAEPSTITIGLAPNAKTPTSPSGMSAIVAKHHDQAVGAVNEENATTVEEETIEGDGTITVDSETTGDDETITADSETTGAEETTETVVVNNVEHSTTTIGHARNVKIQISPLETSATVVKSHALAVVVEADDGATIGDDGTITVDSEMTEDDGTITVDSETTEDDETITVDSETTGDDETITVDSETTGGPVATMASKGTTTEVEIAMVANSEDDLRTDEAVHDLSIVAHLMFNPGEPKESDRVMHTINPQEISEMLHGSLSAEMTEWM